MEPITKAFENGLILPDYIEMQDVERELARPQEELLIELRTTVERRIPQDVHEYISWFACFRESPQTPQPVHGTLQKEQNKNKNNRAKNKQAKKSRKKNRK